MIKYNFRQLVAEISEQFEMPEKDVRNVFKGLLERFNSLQEVGDVLYIKGIGSFKVKLRKPKKFTLNNEEKILPPRKVIVFKRATSKKGF